MRYRITEVEGQPLIQVRLSRRNLLSLLVKLDTAGSVCPLLHEDGDVEATCERGSEYLLVVEAEDDAEHYRGRGIAGIMHPVTEATHPGSATETTTTPRLGAGPGLGTDQKVRALAIRLQAA
jgi:hypothetical protein